MKEQLINKETAILAKEVGISLTALTCYVITDDDIHSNETYKVNWNDIHRTNVYSASTQSILQKVLREEYNIKIVVNSSTKNQFGNWVQWYTHVDNLCIIDHRDGLDTYEEALEKGLYEALLIIKNRKK